MPLSNDSAFPGAVLPSPTPTGSPLTAHVCAAWAQFGELPFEVRSLHSEDTWCSILAFSSSVLWAASGRRWRNVLATETVTLDPPEYGRDTVWPATAQVAGYGLWGYRQPWQWDRQRPNRVRLPRPDVTAVTSASLGGVPFTFYRRSGNWVIRTDRQSWPLQNTTLITYTFGKLVPPSGRLAVITLATELGKAFAGKVGGMPCWVNGITQRGVTLTSSDSLAVLKDGVTGIHAVDLWIKSANPGGVTQSGQVWTPDTVEART